MDTIIAAGEIYNRSADCTGTSTRLTDDTAADTAPDWQPLVGVGGIAELPEVAGTPVESPGSSGSSKGLLVGIVAAIAAGSVTLGGAAWYARRRWGARLGCPKPSTRSREWCHRTVDQVGEVDDNGDGRSFLAWTRKPKGY